MEIGGDTAIDMEFRILGPLDVLIGGVPVDLGTAKQRSLLTLLVLNANQVVAADRLIDELWGAQPPARAANAVQVYVSYLRKVLEPGRSRGGESHVLVTRRPGYQLRTEPDQVDAFRFERLVDEGRRALAAGDPEAAARHLREGLSLWRGPALADVAYEPFADREASRLEELRVTAIEDRVEADLGRGLHADLVAELDGLVAAYPLRERLWGQRMVALYRCGRQAEALRAYQDLRGALGDELGIEPSPALKRLEEAILLQKDELAWTPAGDAQPVAGTGPELPNGVVTFLLTDIVASTSLWDEHPVAMAEALARHDELVEAEVRSGGGWLLKSKGEGDATVSVFVRASAAVGTAMAVQRAIAAEPWPGDIDLAVRIGVHTGEAQLRDGDYFGPTINRAARLRALADGGHVLLSQATAELVADRLPEDASLRALGQHTLRGLSRPEHVFALVHPALADRDLPYADEVRTPVPAVAEAVPARRHNLPVRLTAFVGRDAARAELAGLLAHARLVTLTGVGGSGKTRLAEQVAAENLGRWPDGVWVVELAGLSDADMVPSAVAAVLGISEQAGRPLVEHLIDTLHNRRLLLVVDNCEHVIDAAAAVVERLLGGCAQLDVLATSRQPLGVAGEVTWSVPPLAVPPPTDGDDAPVDGVAAWESVQLFLDRARLVHPRFEASADDLVEIAGLCRRLDGIPLAIELAAARLRTMTPAQVAARLDDVFAFLTSGSRTALPRQQTLRAMVDWSYDLLDGDEQALFRHLAVFPGPLTVDAVDAVADAPGPDAHDGDTLERLTALMEKSLLVAEDTQGGARFRLLATIRQYAYEKLQAAGEETTYRTRHRDWFRDLAERARPALEAGGDTGWLDTLDDELPNLRAALEWSLADPEGREQAVRMAAALSGFWTARRWSEGREWLERALAATGPLEAGHEAAARSDAAALASLLGDYPAARQQLEASVALGRRLDDQSVVREALHVLGNVSWDHGDFDAAAAAYTEALAIGRGQGDRRAIARTLSNMGSLASWRGDHANAVALCAEALALARELGEGLILRGTLINLAYVSLHMGDKAAARPLIEEALELARQEGHTYDEMLCAGAMADIAIADGNVAGARGLLDEAVRLARRLGDKSALPELLNSLGRVLHDQREYSGAALAQYESLEVATATDQQLFRAQALEGLAAITVTLGDPGRGGQMLGAAEALRDRIGCPFPPLACHVDLEQLMATGRAVLGAADWDAARERGRDMTVEEALAGADRSGTSDRRLRAADHIGDVFVGREAELELLGDSWAHVLSGQRHVMLLAGEPGIGKTRLAAEFAATAAEDGAVVLSGRCEEEMLVPYQPFVDVLRQYVIDAPLARLRTQAAGVAEVTRLVPELSTRLPELPAPRPADPETARYRLFEGVANLLEAVAATSPLVVLLDDLQWADESALLLLKHLSRGRTPARILFLGTYRDTELDQHHPLWEAVADLRREPHFARLALSGLDEQAVGELLHAAGHGTDARPGLAGVLRRETAGNPFFVGEIVRHLIETGANVGAADLVIPDEVRDVIDRRLGRLSAAASSALAVAAVIGDSFEVGVLQQATELSSEGVLAALDEAAGAHLVEELPELDQYRFCHSLVRSALYGGLSASRRARISRRIGLVVEGRQGADVDDHLAVLAHHFGESAVAADGPKAVDYARRAGERALGQLAYEAAADQFHRALDVLSRGDPDDPLRTQLLLSAGDAHNRAGQFDAARAAFLGAADLARAAGRADILAQAAIGYAGQLPIGMDAADPQVLALLDEALAALGDDDSPPRAIALSRLAQARYRSSAEAERLWQSDEALEVARRLDPATLAAVLIARHWTLYGPDDLDERLTTAEEILQLGEALDHAELVLHGRQAQVHDLLELGRVEELAAAAAHRTRLAEELRHPYYLWAAMVTRAMNAATAGDFAAAEDEAARALDYRVRAHSQQAFMVHTAQTVQIRWLQGRLGELDPEWVRRCGWDPEADRSQYIRAWTALVGGRHDDAGRHLDQLVASGLERLPRNIEWFGVMAALSDTAARLGREDDAATLYAMLAPYDGRNCVVGQSGFYGAVSHWLGVLAGALGRYDAAVGHLRTALERHEAMSAPPFVALTQTALSRVLRERDQPGDADEAARLAAEARATAEALGMITLVAELTAIAA